jgi:DNA-directed RNA polymerase specialized sigma54-like protein
MNQNKIHMVPQIVIDCAENLMNTKIDHMRDNYTLRLEAIRDYCNEALKRAGSPTRQVFDRKRKTVDPNDARKWSS